MFPDSIFWTSKEQVNQSRFLLWSRAREAKDKARVKGSSSLSTTSWNVIAINRHAGRLKL